MIFQNINLKKQLSKYVVGHEAFKCDKCCEGFAVYFKLMMEHKVLCQHERMVITLTFNDDVSFVIDYLFLNNDV